MGENSEKLQIEYVDIFELVKWDRNPKDHDLGELHGSITEFGFRKPIIANSENKQIEAGHGRIDTLIQKFNEGKEPPRFIIQGENTWLVPVIWMNDDEFTQYRYSLADNRLQDKGGYDYAKLVDIGNYIYDNASLDYTGYTIDDLEAIAENYLLPDEQQYSDNAADTDDIKDKFEVIVTCRTVQEQKQLWERLKSEGYDCRVTNSKN